MELNNNRQKHLEERVAELERLLAERDELIQDLTSELDKYRSVMPVACNTAYVGHVTQNAVEATPTGQSVMTSQGSARKQRTQGVSAEPHQVPRNLDDLERDTLRTYHKTQRSAELICKAIQSNDFMKHFSSDQLRQIVECMYPVEYKQDAVIIREGDVGSRVYVLEDGRVTVYKDGIKLSTKGPNTVLGELAILYNCTRTATVKALEYCKLWAIDRHVFQAIMMKSELVRQRQCIDWLRRIPKLKNLSDEALQKVLDTMEEVRFKHGEVIIKQGAKTDCLYMITKGKAKETRRNPGLIKDDTLLRHLVAGDFFNEGALETQEVRTSNITVTDCNGALCLLLDRTSWNQLINKLQNDVSLDRGHVTSVIPSDTKSPNKATSNGEHSSVNSDPLNNVRQLNDLVVLSTIGVGGFGRVELVRIRNDQSAKTYALKQMKKMHIVETCQQEHIMNEKSIMSEARCEFIVRLYKTFRDQKYLYMLMEVCLGGELWTLLRDRDLKPENLLIDQTGYLKLVDFGFAKKIGSGRKTWTFCGTPEYVAPEIILNKGHDVAADLWSLGILTYELLTGSPPFTSSEPMKTYNMILKGTIDFPRRVSRNAQSIIKKLCRSDAAERLGYGSNGLREIHKHKWFDGFNWDSLRRRTMKVPYIPKVKSTTDTSNFDSYPADEAGTPPDDTSGWDEDF